MKMNLETLYAVAFHSHYAFIASGPLPGEPFRPTVDEMIVMADRYAKQVVSAYKAVIPSK